MRGVMPNSLLNWNLTLIFFLNLMSIFSLNLINQSLQIHFMDSVLEIKNARQLKADGHFLR